MLGAYEHGERAISGSPAAARLAAVYKVPVDQLLPDSVRVHPTTSGRPIPTVPRST
ncbi:MAG: hypothetical protein R2716_00540 [Microthrixaceae bacterium]